MKALSLTQPWATLIAIGAKRIETRSWSTAHRGQIAIHAAKGFPRDCRELCAEQPFLRELTRAGISLPELPLGAVIAVATLAAVNRTERLDYPGTPISHLELEFGDYSEGRFGWMLKDVIALAAPVACKGALGLWAVSPEIEAIIRKGMQ